MTEAQLQQDIFVFFTNNYKIKGLGIIFSVANEATYKDKKYKNTGVVSGVSDLVVILNNKIIFIELKVGYNKQSESQLKFETNVRNLNQEYHVVRSLDEFKQIISQWTN